MKTRTLRAGNKGFTLFELLIVLFILGLVASVVMFSASRIHDKTVFTQEVRRLFLTARHAREIALMEKRTVSLGIDEESDAYWIDKGDGEDPERYALPHGFQVFGKSIAYFPKGNSSGGLIRLSNGKDREFRIEVDEILGKPTVKGL